MIGRGEKIAALKREIAMRRGVFRRRIAAGTLTPEKAEYEIAVMEAILHDYIGADPSLTDKERET